jgi:hypothetical protein
MHGKTLHGVYPEPVEGFRVTCYSVFSNLDMIADLKHSL